MIPILYVEQWANNFSWQKLEQVEQDLIISRVLVLLYNNKYIKDNLVFRGGTALNKLYLNPPSRYSEDIDFVQRNKMPIGRIIDEIREVLKSFLGYPRWKITQRGVKILYKYESVVNLPSKLKIEININEHFNVLPLVTKNFSVDSKWFNGNSEILTYEIDELMATKLRALYQRRKGRDLYDMWFVSKQKLINIERVINIFSKYCHKDNINISKDEFIANLELKKDHTDFHLDMKFLQQEFINWNFYEAYDFVIENIINKLQ